LLRSVKARIKLKSSISSASPSMTTGSKALSVVIAQCGREARLRALRDARLELNQSASSIHTPQTGIRCGRPPASLVATQ
jgi:hypothetical protein